MKKLFALLLIMSMVLCACSFSGTQQDSRLCFYYPLLTFSYAMNESCLQPEFRQLPETELADILSVYLQGPQDTQTFSSPFPAGTRVVSVSTDEQLLDVTLSSGFSACTGLDLTIACACLAMTCLELTAVQAVRIQAENALLDGAPWVQLQKTDLLLTDPGKDVTQSQ